MNDTLRISKSRKGRDMFFNLQEQPSKFQDPKIDQIKWEVKLNEKKSFTAKRSVNLIKGTEMSGRVSNTLNMSMPNLPGLQNQHIGSIGSNKSLAEPPRPYRRQSAITKKSRKTGQNWFVKP